MHEPFADDPQGRLQAIHDLELKCEQSRELDAMFLVLELAGAACYAITLGHPYLGLALGLAAIVRPFEWKRMRIAWKMRQLGGGGTRVDFLLNEFQMAKEKAEARRG